MDYMFAPWRIRYIKQASENETSDCILCHYPARTDDEQSLILHRGEHNFVIMNRYPYNAGHIMVSPLRHCAALDGLNDAERNEHYRIVARCVAIMRDAFRCDGFNVGMNLGRVAGAGVDQHIHTHIVPRWNGDTNFMPVLGDIKVINEAIADTYKMLKPKFALL
ncbi:MAG: HIT domain-containing protein [Dehalococcoidia bacterium]|nr:HIT domain-containing protein [Dehalococcoidia bacterium]